MIKKYEIKVIRGEKSGMEFGTSMKELKEDGSLRFPTEEAIDSWFNKHISKKTFGEPERDYVHKIDYYKLTPSGNRVLHLSKEFPLDPEYENDIISMGDFEEERAGMIYHKFIYRLKPEYTVETSDLEADIQAAESAALAEQLAKEECCERLASIDWSSKTTIASLKPILQDLIAHLGIEPSE